MSAAGTLNLRLDITMKRAVYSLISETPFSIASFTQGEVLPVVIEILRYEGIPNQFSKPAIDGMGIEFSFCDVPSVDAAGASPFVSQYTWTKDTTLQTFSANVAFNTAALGTWLTGLTEKTGTLRIVLVEGLARTEIYRANVKVYAGTAAVGDVAPGSTPLSYERAVQTFASLVHAAGDAEIWTSPGGNKFRFYPEDDGTPHFDPIT